MHTIQPQKRLAGLFAAAFQSAHGTGPFRQVRRALLWVLDRVLVWQERANQRHRLQMMSDAALKDMGISRADVTREAMKPFWMA